MTSPVVLGMRNSTGVLQDMHSAVKYSGFLDWMIVGPMVACCSACVNLIDLCEWGCE